MFKQFCHEEIDSTNEEARRLLLVGKLTVPSLVVAKSQTAGRGTQGRSWVSPKGAGLYFSLVHPFGEAHPPVTPVYTLAAGAACAEALLDVTGLTIQLKPVNDLYLAGNKLGGILTESFLQGEHLKAMITGVGLNLRETERKFDGADRRGVLPTSMEAHLPPHQFERLLTEELLLALATRIHHFYGDLIAGRQEAVLARYAEFQLPGTPMPALPEGAACPGSQR